MPDEKEIKNEKAKPKKKIRISRLYEKGPKTNWDVYEREVLAQRKERESKSNEKFVRNITSDQEIFGENYNEKYNEEQKLILKKAFRYSKNNDNIDIDKYKPEYSVKKLSAIFYAQKNNLDISVYKEIKDEYLDEVLSAQTNGLSNKEILSIYKNSDTVEKFKENRLKKEQDKKILITSSVKYNEALLDWSKTDYTLDQLINNSKQMVDQIIGQDPQEVLDEILK